MLIMIFIHLAAIVGDPACSKFSDEAKETNWDGSVNLFEECEKSGVEDLFLHQLVVITER